MREFALSLPGAWEDHPWGESVVKVGKKVFVFFGTEETRTKKVSVGVKLPDSKDVVLDIPGAELMGYGMGKAGWVWAHMDAKEAPPVEILCEWIEESYRTIAPKKLVKELDGAAPPTG